MDRRQLLKTAGAAACVAAVPDLLNILLSGQTEFPHEWRETVASENAMSRMKPLLEKYDKKQGAHSLTPDEWDEFADAHEEYFSEHIKNGDLHRVDIEIKSKEAILKRKFNHDSVNYIIEHGSAALFTKAPYGIHKAAEKLRTEPYQPAERFLSCGGFWSTMSIGAGILGFFFPEAELFFVGLAVYYYLIENIAC